MTQIFKAQYDNVMLRDENSRSYQIIFMYII